VGILVPEMKSLTHYLRPHLRHLGAPAQEKLSARPIGGAHQALSSLHEISRFETDKQPEATRIIFGKKLINRHF